VEKLNTANAQLKNFQELASKTSTERSEFSAKTDAGAQNTNQCP